MKIRISDLFTIMIYHLLFINIPYFSGYNIIMFIFTFFLSIYLVTKITWFSSKKYKKINLLLLLFFLWIVISALYNNNHSYRGIFFAIKALYIFLYFEYVNQKNLFDRTLKIFYKLTLIYCVITDILLIFVPSLTIIHQGYYLTGNKFTVSYLHIILTTLYIYINKKQINNNTSIKIHSAIYVILTFLISYLTKCTTAIIGSGILLIAILFPRLKKILLNPTVVLSTLTISCSLLLCFSQILRNPYVLDFIVNVLHEDPSLTGRTIIYERIFPTISKSLIFGYGYGNSYEVVIDAISAPNTQNGILECILNFGIPGTILFLLLIYKIFKNLKRNFNDTKDLYIIVACIYVFIILGMVEITYDLALLSLLSIVNIGDFKLTNNKIESGEKNV